MDRLVFPILASILATVVALVLLVPMLQRPDLQLVNSKRYDDPYTIGLKIHNDSSKSAVECVGQWEIRTARGTLFTYRTYNAFSVPGNDYAQGLYGTGLPKFKLSQTFFDRLSRHGWTNAIYVVCLGYKRKIGSWT